MIKKIKNMGIIATLLAITFSANADLNFGNPEAEDNAPFKLNQDYSVLRNPIPAADPNSVDIINFYSYGCDSCVKVVKSLENWRKKMPYYTKIYYSPIAPTLEESYPARIFFTIEELNREDLKIPFLETSVDGKTNLSDIKVLVNWFDGRGINVETLNKAINSKIVQAKVDAAPTVMKMYEIDSIPTIVVNGKYKISGNAINSNDLAPLIEYLSQKSIEENKGGN